MTERATSVSADEEYRRENDRLGMYLFLATEVMLFGAVFAGLVTYRILYPEEIASASQRLDVVLGTINTALLLTSSLLVAVAGKQAEAGQHRRVAATLGAAAAMGVAFLAIKGVEYYQEFAEGLMPGAGPRADDLSPVEELFFNIYFVATGLHAIHLLIGVAMLLVFVAGCATRALPLPGRAHMIEIGALYWHLVDLIWVFLFPALYLVRV